jgi:hypothetical protein
VTDDRAALLRHLDALNADLRSHSARPDITIEAAEGMTDEQLRRAVERTADHLLTLVGLADEAARPLRRRHRKD